MSSFDPKGKRIWVAGHRGMVGSAVVRRLAPSGCDVLLAGREQVDLVRQDSVDAWMARARPHAIVLAAARVGGIVANDTQPADFIYENLMIEANVIHAAWKNGVEKLLFLGSTCIYPRLAPQPLNEDALLTGQLEPTNEWYAIAKIAGIKLCQAYRKQHGSDFFSMMPTNLYGPNDNFDLKSSHVLPALIRKFHEAKGVNGLPDAAVPIWGSGKPLREFLYVDDMADATVFAMEQPADLIYETAPDGILNVGAGYDLSIRELAELVRDVVGSNGPIEYDASKPDGTPRKLMDVSRMTKLGWTAGTSLRNGIEHAYAWFQDHYLPV